MIHMLWTCPSSPRGGQKAEGRSRRHGRDRGGSLLAAPYPIKRRFEATKVMEASFDVEDAMISIRIMIIYDVA